MPRNPMNNSLTVPSEEKRAIVIPIPNLRQVGNFAMDVAKAVNWKRHLKIVGILLAMIAAVLAFIFWLSCVVNMYGHWVQAVAIYVPIHAFLYSMTEDLF